MIFVYCKFDNAKFYVKNSSKNVPKVSKMKKITYFLSLFSLLILANSCSPELRPFSSNLLKEGGWSDTDLKKIQFYLSDDVVIRRKLTEGSSEITSGTIKIVKGEKLEEVRIPHGTPGVFLFRVKEDHFAIGFDGSSDKRYLMFGPNPKQRGTYMLLATEWQDKQGKVRYDDKFYFTNPDAVWANLMVDLKKIKHVQVSSNTVKGRKVE
jgi:hypothetical protein